MVKVNKGQVEIEGNDENVRAEIATLLHSYVKACTKRFGKKIALENAKAIYEQGIMSDKELKEKANKKLKEIFGELDDMPIGLALVIAKSLFEDIES